MTVRAILDAKGRQVVSIGADAKAFIRGEDSCPSAGSARCW